jgi:hypothetical protein
MHRNGAICVLALQGFMTMVAAPGTPGYTYVL